MVRIPSSTMDNPNDILLSKWLQKTITDIEMELLIQEYDLESLSEILKMQESLEFELVPAEELWSSIEGKLTKEEPVPDVCKTKPPGSRSLMMALLLLGLVLSALLFFFLRPASGEVNIETKPAQKVQQIIAENTTADLAPGSSIIYNKETWQDSRSIKLKGQAFFDVSKGDKFTVHTSIGDIEVLGTEFEIWERDDILKVSCYEGKVRVVNIQGHSKAINAGERVIIRNGRLGNIEKHSAVRAGFLDGRVSYDKIEFALLAKEIERFYNVTVDTKGVENTESFSGILISDDIEKACLYISETLDLKYETGKEKIEFYSE